MSGREEIVLVHTSDLHVDDGHKMNAHDGTEGLRAVLATARSVDADIVLLVGDTFDNHRVPMSILQRTAEMLRDVGASLVIVGHSERRAYHHETDDGVHAKALGARRADFLGGDPYLPESERFATGAPGTALGADLLGQDRLTVAPGGSGSKTLAFEPEATTLAVVALTLLGAATAASWLPARRATTVSSAEVLRGE